MKNKTLLRTISTALAVIMVLCSASLSNFIGMNFFDFGIEAEAIPSKFINITESETISVTITGGSLTYIKLVPQYTTTYTLTSNSNSDTYAYLFDSNMAQLATNDDGGEGSNFMISYDMIAGQTYYYGVRYYSSSTSGTFSVTLTRNCDHEFSAYDLKCVLCGEFALSYTITEGSVTITGADSALNGVPIIPSIIEGCPVTCIGNRSFSGCNNIVSIEIPDSVTSIDGYAFYECTGLKSITVSDNVTSIGDYAFGGCTALETIVFPDMFETVGSNVIWGTKYYENQDNWEDGVLYLNDILLEVDRDLVSGSYRIKDGTKVVSTQAFFDCDGITSLHIPASVEFFNNDVFYDDYAYSYNGTKGCDNLEKIIVDEDNMYYSNDEFGVLFNKDKTVLIHFPIDLALERYEIPAETKTLDEYSFYCAKNLCYLALTENVNKIGSFAINGCKSLIEISVNRSAEFSDYGISLFSLVLPDNNSNMGSWSVANCDNLQRMTLPNNMNTIGWYACTSNKKLEYVKLPSDLISIDYYAFSYNTGLKDIKIPDGVETIGFSAFEGCTSLKSFNIPKNLTCLSGGVFNECASIEKITIPENITRIESYAFRGCTNLASIKLHSNIETIESEAFNNTKYYNDVSNWENGVLYIDEYLIEAKDTISGLYTVKAGTKSIAFAAFRDCKNLTSINFPDSLINIESCAFQNCIKLMSITIPDGVKSIGRSTFENCDSLTSVVVPNSVVSICEDAFYNCDNLADVVLGKRVETIESWAFTACDKLASITLHNAIKVIEDSAFSYSYNIDDVYFKGTEEDWNKITIGENNTSLTSATLHFLGEEYMVKSVSIDDFAMTYKSNQSLGTLVKVDAVEGFKYTITYESSEPSVATVDKDGNVTAIGTGESEIKVIVTDEYGNIVEDTCKVTVSYVWWQWLIIILLFGWIWY